MVVEARGYYEIIVSQNTWNWEENMWIEHMRSAFQKVNTLVRITQKF